MPVILTEQPSPYDFMPNRLRWTRQQCDAMRDAGFLTGRYELIDGEILSKMGQKPSHAYVINLLMTWLVGLFGAEFVRIHSTIDLSAVGSPYDEPEPDAVLAKQIPFVDKLNSQARQAAAERAAYAVSRHLHPDVNGNVSDPPAFQKDCRSVEYKTTGWKLSEDRKRIAFTDGHDIGLLKMLGTQDLCAYSLDLIKRVRILRRADGYYVQFCIAVDRSEELAPSGANIGLDMGLSAFYTDSNGGKVGCPKFLRKAEKQIKKLQRRVSRKQKKSSNRRKAANRLARKHLQVQRQRKDWAIKLARCVVMSNDVIAVEDLQIANMVKNHCPG